MPGFVAGTVGVSSPQVQSRHTAELESALQYEVDFLAVGEGERSGDAIALRFGEDLAGPPRQQTVVIIDGGTKESGEALVQHVRTFYGTSEVDLILSTHPDVDHASGLTVLLEELTVHELAMHRPWEHACEIRNIFKSGKRLEEKLEKALEAAADLESLAEQKGVRIIEPFQGVGNESGSLLVLGPSREYYQSLLRFPENAGYQDRRHLTPGITPQGCPGGHAVHCRNLQHRDAR